MPDKSKLPADSGVGFPSDANAGDGAKAGIKPLPKRKQRLIIASGEQDKLPPIPSPKPPTKVEFVASIYPKDPKLIPSEFGIAIEALEETLKMPIWLLVQSREEKNQFDSIGGKIVEEFLACRSELPEKEPIALLIDSEGGSAKCAYRIATIIRRHCGEFTAVVPRYAKSAATLLTLGARHILLGKDAELGPLDAQFWDDEREDYLSALDEVQALERLHAFSLEAIDRSMLFMVRRTGKKIETLLPLMLRFVSDMMRPLFEKIDTVHYTQTSRALKVAEDYAIRLLQPAYSRDAAQEIAHHLVENYPEHGFVIDSDETTRLKLRTQEPSSDQIRIMNTIYGYLGKVTTVGRLKRVKNGNAQQKN